MRDHVRARAARARRWLRRTYLRVTLSELRFSALLFCAGGGRYPWTIANEGRARVGEQLTLTWELEPGLEPSRVVVPTDIAADWLVESFDWEGEEQLIGPVPAYVFTPETIQGMANADLPRAVSLKKATRVTLGLRCTA